MLGALSFATPAHATTPSDAAASQALFERGRKAAERGDFQLACSSFAESQRLDPGAGTLMNWATCEARQGQLAAAWQHFNEAATLLRPGDDRAAFVQRQIRALSARLPRLTVRLSAVAPAGTLVLRNGIALSEPSMGVPLPVDPGNVELLVTCAGHHPRRSVLPIAEGEQLELTLEPGEPYAPVAPSRGATNQPAPRTEAEPGRWQRDLGISLVALGSLGAGLGLASGVVVAARKASADAHCPAQRCDDQGLRAADSGERWLVVNTVAWSAAALLGGGALWLTAPSRRREATLQPIAGGAALSYAEHF